MPYATAKIAPLLLGPATGKDKRIEILSTPGVPFGIWSISGAKEDVDSPSIAEAVQAANIPADSPASMAEEHFGDLLSMLNRQFLTSKKGVTGVLGMLAGTTLIMARVGTPHVFLWRKGPTGTYQRFSLWKDGEEEPNARQFSHILTGEVQDGDALLISLGWNERLYATEFDRVIPALPPEGAAEALAARLSAKPTTHALQGVIVRCALRESHAAVTPATTVHPSPSRDLQRAMKPSLLGDDFPLVHLLRMANAALNNSRRARRGNRGLATALGAMMRGLLRLLLALATLATTFATLLFIFSTNWRGSRTRLMERVRARARQYGQNFAQLPVKSRAFLLLGLALGLLFTRGVASLASAKVHEAEADNFRAAIAEIEGKRDAVEATIIYGDENRANEILDETYALFAKLPRRSAEERQTVSTLGETINAFRERLRHAIRLPDPTVVALLPADKNYLGLMIQDGTLVSWTLDGQIYAANPQNGKTGTVLTVLDEPGSINLGAVDEGGLIFWNGRKLTRWAKGERVAAALEFTPASDSPLRSIAIWNKRLYALDEAGNVWRHDRLPNGFGKGVPWLKNTPPLSGTVAMAIDGALWGAKENGEVIKIFAGLPQAFTAGATIPPLRQTVALATDAEAQYLYLLEPAEKRLVVYGKDGKLATQYISDQFDTLSAVAVSEKTKTIYLLNKNVIYGIIATHLQK